MSENFLLTGIDGGYETILKKNLLPQIQIQRERKEENGSWSPLPQGLERTRSINIHPARKTRLYMYVNEPTIDGSKETWRRRSDAVQNPWNQSNRFKVNSLQTTRERATRRKTRCSCLHIFTSFRTSSKKSFSIDDMSASSVPRHCWDIIIVSMSAIHERDRKCHVYVWLNPSINSVVIVAGSTLYSRMKRIERERERKGDEGDQSRCDTFDIDEMRQDLSAEYFLARSLSESASTDEMHL